TCRCARRAGRTCSECPSIWTRLCSIGTTKTSLPMVIDFWAAWCGPCRTMAPTFAAVAQELAGEVVFAKVDTEREPVLATRFEIRSIPCLVLPQGGREMRRQSGALGRSQLVQWLRGQ
ncbi:MAG: thioredoxin domain-containing protein, partial [Planctomycetota bacterium]